MSHTYTVNVKAQNILRLLIIFILTSAYSINKRPLGRGRDNNPSEAESSVATRSATYPEDHVRLAVVKKCHQLKFSSIREKEIEGGDNRQFSLVSKDISPEAPFQHEKEKKYMVIHSCVLAAMAYGCNTWKLNKSIDNKSTSAQKTIDRSVSGITIGYKKKSMRDGI